MRRATTWLLILGLFLLALCVVWFLRRLVREEAPILEDGVTSAEVHERAGGSGIDSANSRPPSSTPPVTPGPVESSSPRESRTDAAATVAAGEEPCSIPGSVAGRLVDRTGRPVSGATVLAAHAADLGTPVEDSTGWISHLPLDIANPMAIGAEVPVSATSDAAGRFAFDHVEPGRVRLAVRSMKHAPLDRNDLWLASGGALDLGDVALDPPWEIYGTLEDEEGRPVMGAPLIEVDGFTDASLAPLSPSVGTRLAETDGRGRFRSPPMGPGPWCVRALGGKILVDVEMRGNAPADGWNRLETMAETAPLRGSLATRGPVPDGLVVRALPALLAQGRVPFASRADARQGPVSRNGSFEVAGVTPGVLYELRAGAADERWEDESLWSPPTFAAVSEDRAQVAWEPDASVILGVFDAGSRSAVAACEITLEGALPARTLFDEPSSDPNGMRTVEGVRPLRPFQGAMVRVRSRGFQPVSQRLELRPGSGVSIGHLSLGPLPALAVHVVDAATGAPLRGAIVTATEISTDRDASDLAPQGIATDAAGEARVCSYVGAGSRVEVRASGYATMRRLGPLGGGFSSPRLEFRLVRGATARVRAVDGEGRVVAGTRIEWIEGDWSPNDVAAFETPRPISERPDPGTSRIADLEGRAVFRHLAPGRHAFRVQHYGDYLDSEWTQRDLRDGEDLEIELQSRARTSLEVRVSDGGIPLAGAPAVLVRRPRGSSLLQLAEVETPLPPGLDAHLDARGTWVFLNVDPGLYALALGVPGQRLRACREVKVREGSNVLLLDLAHTAVAGRVGWTGGRPAGGAELFLAAPDRERVLREGARRRGFQGIPSAELLALGVEHPAASVDENGEFRLLGLPLAEPFTIVARAGLDGLGRSEPVLIQADSGPQDVPFAVLPAGSVELRASSRPMAWPCTVVAFPMKGSSGRGSSGERRSDEKQALPRIRRIFPGCAEILGALEPGVWEIELGYEGTRARDRRRVEIVAGETRSVELSLP